MRDKIKAYLLSFTKFEQYVEFFYKYCNYLIDERVNYSGTVTQIIVFVIRCNERIEFNGKPMNNDLLVCVEFVGNDNYNVYTFNVTADPKAPQSNIAHLIEQVYTGNIRNHRQILGRLAICSDNGAGTWIKRTTGTGEALKPTLGHYGINIHDNGGFLNSSLGCVILESSEQYKTVFKPLLQRVSNKNNIPVAVINQDYFTDELKVLA